MIILYRSFCSLACEWCALKAANAAFLSSLVGLGKSGRIYPDCGNKANVTHEDASPRGKKEKKERKTLLFLVSRVMGFCCTPAPRPHPRHDVFHQHHRASHPGVGSGRPIRPLTCPNHTH